MINVSNEFFRTMEKRRNFTEYAVVTLTDGTVLTLTEEDFTVDNNSFTESAGSSGLPLGVAMCRTVQIEIVNPGDIYSGYDFVGAEIDLQLRFRLSSGTETFDIGHFTVIDPFTYGETIIVTAVDDMHKADVYYSTTMAFPATIGAILADVCNTTGITLATTTFQNDSFVIDNRPSGNYIVRNLIGYIAMIAGGNARINRNGQLEIVSYDFSVLNDIAVRGGTFSPWTTGDTLSGGTLDPWTTGDTESGGDFTSQTAYHLLKNFKNLKVDTDDIEITGVSMVVENDIGVQNLLSGTEGYVVNIENPLLTGKEEEALALIASVLVGGKMRKFEGDHIAYPLAEFMDPCVVVDKKGNMYPSILTEIDFTFFGYTKFKNTAQSKESLKTKTTSKYQSELIKVVQKTEELVQAEKTAREEAIANLNNTMQDASGMYVSDVTQSDGSTIRYLHDRPTLAESQNVIKITAEAIGISNDGGATYSYGMTMDGETITRLLYAEGIDADYITVGKISDASGENYWDLEKGELVIKAATIDGSLISVTVTADEITTGRITDSSGDNYWDLDSGEMVITNATIEDIDASEITTGRITDKKNNNYWDMDTGEMVINKATINTSLDASKITTGTLNSDRIDVDELFSQEITATNMTLTGASKIVSEATDYSAGQEVIIENGEIQLLVEDHAADRIIHNGYASYYVQGVYSADPEEDSGIKISDTRLRLREAKLEIDGNVMNDFVVAQGTSGIWTYEKWNSGRAVVYGNYSASGVNAAANQMNGFYYSGVIEVTFPFSFVGNTPTVSFDNGPTNCVCFLRDFASNGTKARFIVMGLDSTLTNISFTAKIIAYGRWE